MDNKCSDCELYKRNFEFKNDMISDKTMQEMKLENEKNFNLALKYKQKYEDMEQTAQFWKQKYLNLSNNTYPSHVYREDKDERPSWGD